MELVNTKGFLASVVFVVAFGVNHAFPLSSDANAPTDSNDPNSHRFVWVVALEKDSPGQDCTNWSPTLYKISVGAGRVVEKEKLAEQGAPIFCYSLPDDRIWVILKEGIASNGTYPWDEMTIDLTVDKNRMSIIKTKNGKSYPDDVEEYRKTVHMDKRKQLNIKKPKNLVEKKGERFLGVSKNKQRVFMFKGFLADNQTLRLEVLDPNSLTTMQSMSLKVGNRKLGSFFGAEAGDVVFLAEQYLICLFYGNSRLGVFAPGYVIIIDMKTKIVKCIAIGSNPARGIAY